MEDNIIVILNSFLVIDDAIAVREVSRPFENYKCTLKKKREIYQDIPNNIFLYSDKTEIISHRRAF